MGSGTSLVALSLAQEAECAALIYESALQVTAGSFLRAGTPESYETVAAFGESLSVCKDWSVERGRSDLLRLYRSYARGQSEVVVDKGPNANLARAGFLAHCFPQSAFVLVVRDPVANVEGLRRKWPRFATDTLESSIDFYRDLYEKFLDESEAMANSVLTIEYEAVVYERERVISTLCKSLGIEPRTSTMRFRPRANVAGMGIRNVRPRGIDIVTDANEEARARLDPVSAATIREALGELHSRLRERALRDGLGCLMHEKGSMAR
jgi:hypothetical protein